MTIMSSWGLCNNGPKEEKSFANIMHDELVFVEDCMCNKLDCNLTHDLVLCFMKKLSTYLMLLGKEAKAWVILWIWEPIRSIHCCVQWEAILRVAASINM